MLMDSLRIEGKGKVNTLGEKVEVNVIPADDKSLP